jgi:hypothetical protein
VLIETDGQKKHVNRKQPVHVKMQYQYITLYSDQPSSLLNGRTILVVTAEYGATSGWVKVPPDYRMYYCECNVHAEKILDSLFSRLEKYVDSFLMNYLEPDGQPAKRDAFVNGRFAVFKGIPRTLIVDVLKCLLLQVQLEEAITSGDKISLEREVPVEDSEGDSEGDSDEERSDSEGESTEEQSDSDE